MLGWDRYISVDAGSVELFVGSCGGIQEGRGGCGARGEGCLEGDFYVVVFV